MRNTCLGVDKQYGEFYLFHLPQVHSVIHLLAENSFVRFGDSMFHQHKGVPMCINPAVFMAIFHVYYYESRFVEQLVAITDADL